MISFFRQIWAGLAGGGGDKGADIPSAEPVEYKGYRIRPVPYPAKGQYQTAGLIEKEFGSDVKEYRFVRAETHPSKDDASAFAIVKAKQIIDEQGDRIFD